MSEEAEPDEPSEEPLESPAGLCEDCRHVRKLQTKIGATIYLCGLWTSDARLPKFPALPVTACVGFDPQRG